jgi:glyoxylate reductase
MLPRVREELARSFDFTEYDRELPPPPREEVLAAVAGVDGFIAMITDRVDAELLDAAGPQLRIVANHGVGYDNVDVEAAQQRGVVVTNTPDVLTAATAELTIALLLAIARRVAEGDRLIRRREPWQWYPTFFLGADLPGSTLGCVGFGRIGREVARLAEAFGMRVVHTTRSGHEGDEGWLPLERLLAESDVVSLHLPASPETRHLIDASALARMKPTALLVNTARGTIVDEAALADALRERRIAGAALDVYEHEPETHPGLLDLDNVVLTPHIGSATSSTREAMAMLCVDALRAVLLEGRIPPNVVT